MLKSRRRLSVAALAAMILAATGSSLAAQETNTVGPAQLKDFRLPGTRTTPPVVQPEPGTQTPPVTTRPAPAPPATTAQPARTPPRSTAPTTAPPRRTPADPAPGASAAPPASTAPSATVAAPPVETFPVAPPAARPLPAPTASAPDSSWSWPWIGGALLLALLGFLGFRRFGAYRAEAARRAKREERAAARAAAAAAAAATPEPAPGPRARLQLGFIPDRAVATDSETAVHYDLLIRNEGELPARNIRIDARMFNAGAQAAISAFLNGPIHERSGSPHVAIPPGGKLELASSIAMPKEEVKTINVQGLSIFVPIVAINVAYDWGEGLTGRTSLSWLVGREPETPSAKMGAFRLDLGPRIYRSVGQRPTELANVA